MIETGKDALFRYDDASANTIFNQFLTDYPECAGDNPVFTHLRASVERLLAKSEHVLSRKSLSIPAEPDQKVSPSDQARALGYLHEWLVLGPLPIPENPADHPSATQSEDKAEEQSESPLAALIEHDFLESVGGEANVRPAPEGRFNPDGNLDAEDVLRWHVHDLLPVQGMLNQLPGFDVESGIAYLTTYVKAAATTEGNLMFSGENTLAIWVNGEQVWQKTGGSGPPPNPLLMMLGLTQNRVTVNIPKGWNVLLVKTALLDTSPNPESWHILMQLPGMVIRDVKTTWKSHGEINTADGFNAVLTDQTARFVLTMDVLRTTETNAIAGMDVLLPEPLRHADAKIIGALQVGDRFINATSSVEGEYLKVRWTDAIDNGKTIVGNFEAGMTQSQVEPLSFSVKLVDENGDIVQEVEERDTDSEKENANGFSGIISVDDVEVSAPVNVSAEPVYGENDVVIRWNSSEDMRVHAYEIRANGETVGYAHGRTQTEWRHHNLQPETTISYTVRAIVVPQLESPLSPAATATVGTDTTDPLPPPVVDESIPLGAGDNNLYTRMVSWGSSPSKDIVHYEVLRGGETIATVPAEITSYLDEEPSELEGYSVNAVDDGGNSAANELEFVSSRHFLNSTRDTAKHKSWTRCVQ